MAPTTLTAARHSALIRAGCLSDERLRCEHCDAAIEPFDRVLCNDGYERVYGEFVLDEPDDLHEDNVPASHAACDTADHVAVRRPALQPAVSTLPTAMLREPGARRVPSAAAPVAAVVACGTAVVIGLPALAIGLVVAGAVAVVAFGWRSPP